jgi:hypothetical protein
MTLEADQSRKPEVFGPSDFTQEVMREVLRQNAEVLRVLLSPMIYIPPKVGAEEMARMLKEPRVEPFPGSK